MAQIQYASSTFAPKTMYGRTLTLNSRPDVQAIESYQGFSAPSATVRSVGGWAAEFTVMWEGAVQGG